MRLGVRGILVVVGGIPVARTVVRRGDNLVEDILVECILLEGTLVEDRHWEEDKAAA